MVMRRLIGTLWSLTWLGALLVGLPVWLIRYVGWYWPHGQQWRQWVMDPMIPPVLIDVFATILWLLWALLLYGILIEIRKRVRRLTRGPRLRLPPLPTPMQATASGIIGATVFSTTTSTAAPVVPPPPTPTTATMTHATSNPVAQVPPAVADPTDAAPTADARPIGQTGVVVLPDGGWISHHTAVAVDAAAALVWWQRRRRYIPQPPTGPVRTDADLTPLPVTVTTIQHQLHPLPDDEAAPLEATPPPAQATTTGVIDFAERLLRIGDLPIGGLGLVGPAALDAARGLLIAALLTGQHPDGDEPRVITTNDVLATLLDTPATAQQHHDTLGLQTLATLTDAIAVAEQLALHRAPPPPEPTSGPTATAQQPTPADRRAPVVLICAPPTNPQTARRLAVLLTFAAHIGVTGVLLGSWPHGSTWHIDPSAATNTSGHGGARLSVLNATATTDLLTLYQQAHPTRQQPPTTRHNHQHPSPSDTTAPRETPRPAQSTQPPGGVRAAHPQARLRLQVLGPPTLYPAGDTPPLRLNRNLAIPILVFLALHPDGATTSDLTTALWPQLHPSSTTNRFYATMSRLRATLDPLAEGPTIIHDAERYHLDPHRIDVDLWRLHTALHAATAAVHTADRAHQLRQVINTYTGELAHGRHWPWLAPHREAIRRHIIDAHVSLATHHTDPQAALGLLQAAARIDPDNDDLRQRLTQQQHRTGSP
jgi:DNA-binding SARP family transcriptional activator